MSQSADLQNAAAAVAAAPQQQQQQAPPLTLRSLLGDADMDMLRDCFIAIDHDGDGLISADTIAAVVSNFLGADRFAAYSPYLSRIFEAADKDRDGFLSLVEFIECYAEGPGIVPQDVVAACVKGVLIRMSDEEVNVLQKVFFRMDTDEDGLVGKGELEAALTESLLLKFGDGSAIDLSKRKYQRRIKKYAHLTAADIATIADNIIVATDRDMDGKLNVSDFILSFQYDQKIIPLELIEDGTVLTGGNIEDNDDDSNGYDDDEDNGDGVGKGNNNIAENDKDAKSSNIAAFILEPSTSASVLVGLHTVFVPLLAASNSFHENENNNANDVSVVTASVKTHYTAVDADPLQAPYGKLFTKLRTHLQQALVLEPQQQHNSPPQQINQPQQREYSLDDIDAIADGIIEEGEEVYVCSHCSVSRGGEPDARDGATTEVSIRRCISKMIDLIEQRLAIMRVGAEAGHGDGGDDNALLLGTPINDTIGVNTTMYDEAGSPILPPPPTAVAPTGGLPPPPPLPPLPFAEAGVGTSTATTTTAAALKRPPSATNNNNGPNNTNMTTPTSIPYPSQHVSDTEASAAAVTLLGSARGTGGAQQQQGEKAIAATIPSSSRPSSANTNKTYQQPTRPLSGKLLSGGRPQSGRGGGGKSGANPIPRPPSAGANANSASNAYLPQGAASETTTATAPAPPRYQPYVHPPITALSHGGDVNQPSAAHSYSTSSAATSSQPQKLLDPEALKKVFVYLASNIVMTRTIPNANDDNQMLPSPTAFVQRMVFRDVKALTSEYLADVFPQWSNAQVSVAVETLWSKAVSAGAKLNLIAAGGSNDIEDGAKKIAHIVGQIHGNDEDDDNEDGAMTKDGAEDADMGYLSLEAFIHSYKIGGELTAVMADCTTFPVVNIGVLPLSVANKIARSPVGEVLMNKIQRSVVRGAFLAILRAVNETRLAARDLTLESILLDKIKRDQQRLKEKEDKSSGAAAAESNNEANSAANANTDDPAMRYCTTDIAIDDLRFTLQRALEPFYVFDRDPATAEVEEYEIFNEDGVSTRTEKHFISLTDKLIRVASMNDTCYDSNPLGAEGRLCVNLFSVAESLGIALPSSMTVILSGGEGCNDPSYDNYDIYGNKVTSDRGVDSAAGAMTAADGDGKVTASNDDASSFASPFSNIALTPFEFALIGAMLQRVSAQEQTVATERLEEIVTDVFIPPLNKKAMENDEVSMAAARDKIAAVMKAIEAVEADEKSLVKKSDLPQMTATGKIIPAHLREGYDEHVEKTKRENQKKFNPNGTRPMRIKVAYLAQKFEESPTILRIGLTTSSASAASSTTLVTTKTKSSSKISGVSSSSSSSSFSPYVAAAIDGLSSCGLDVNDLRSIAAFLVQQDYYKDGVLDLTETYKDLKRLVTRGHPLWDHNQIDRPARLILDTAVLNAEGKITLQPIIRAMAAEFYLTPEKHSRQHSGALSRRLDMADLTRIRRAIESVSGSAPIDEQTEALRAALVEVGVVGDAASLTAMLDTIIGCLRHQKITTEKLAENLLENPSLLSFPIMLARDCIDVCIRKLLLSVPAAVLQVITRSLLLMDRRGDGVLRRDAVDEKLTRELTRFFGASRQQNQQNAVEGNNSMAAAATAAGDEDETDLNAAIIGAYAHPPTAAGSKSTPSSSSTISSARSKIILSEEKIAEIVRLIILSQFEQINQNRFGKPLGQSATHANRNLEMSAFIDALLDGCDGAIPLPRVYMPDVEVPFKLPLGYDEMEILKGAIESIALDRRNAMTATDLANLLESAISDKRRPFVKIIGDVMLKLADGPENSRFDLTELSNRFSITQKMLTFHTSQFSPQMCTRVAGRVIRREKIRRLARVFITLDTNNDERLSKAEIYSYLLSDAQRTISDKHIAESMANSRWGEIEGLAYAHAHAVFNNNNTTTTVSPSTSGALIVGGGGGGSGGNSNNNNTASAPQQFQVLRRTQKEIASSNTRIPFETFLSTFCLGRFPILSEMELESVLKKAASLMHLNNSDASSPMTPSRQAQQNLVVQSGGAAHRLVRFNASCSNSPTVYGGNNTTTKENAAGDYDTSGIALPYEEEGEGGGVNDSRNANRSRYLSARNLSDVPIFDDELQQEFNRFDVDGNGYLNRKDFERIYRNDLEYFGIRPSVAAVDALFRSICVDKDKVSFEEFCMLMLRRSKM